MARKYGGTGLGLVICRSLVELMGGEIEADPDVREGAAFRFSIRTRLPEDARLRPPRPVNRSG
ncbi:ATP-binding protein [Paenibacillus sp. CC-CFT747]|nr:ATP-binding protein [Paenibacillus sp. CC-CFT747]